MMAKHVRDLMVPLDHCLRVHTDPTLRDVMVPVDVCIDEGASLEEAVHALSARWTQSILVTCAGEIVGILLLSDVFEEMAAQVVANGWPDSLSAGSV
jgi:CBS-domain-containing membrane protein